MSGPHGTPLQRLAAWLDARQPRERIVLVGGALGFILVMWSQVLMAHALGSATAAQDELKPMRQRNQTLTLEIETLAKRVKIDPNDVKRMQIGQLEGEIGHTLSQLSERTADLITPIEMAKVMRDLLARESELQLVALDAGHGEAIFEHPLPQSGIGKLYKHTLQIELSGDYLATVRYLQSVEQLPWALLWESLEYKVEKHPRARIRLTVHSLGAQEEWIGV